MYEGILRPLILEFLLPKAVSMIARVQLALLSDGSVGRSLTLIVSEWCSIPVPILLDSLASLYRTVVCHSHEKLGAGFMSSIFHCPMSLRAQSEQ
jgi:hypothetical protein